MLRRRRLVLYYMLLLVVIVVFVRNLPTALPKIEGKAIVSGRSVTPEVAKEVIVPKKNVPVEVASKKEEVIAKEIIMEEVADEMKQLTKAKENVAADEMIKLNPGCENREINSYKTHDVGIVYDHPLIVHYANLGRPVGQLSFREYTSVLSIYKFVKPQRIMFHINYGEFTGKYWEMIKSFEGVSIEVNKIPRVEKIGGKRVNWVQHAADFVKLNMIHKYGGIALDLDVIMINGSQLKNEQRISECVLSGESEYVNIGFLSCIRNSSFITKWLETYHKDYQPAKWVHNSSYKPMHILTDKKSNVCYNVHLDDSICLKPNWGQRTKWLHKGAVEWQNKTAAHYYLKHNIPHDGEGLLLEHFPLAKLFQYIHNA